MLDDKLREEILESQKVQSQLAKWKLILIAGVGAAALGAVPGVDRAYRYAALAIIPLACLYVDILGFHNSARIMKIARYFRMRHTRPLGFAYLAKQPDLAGFDDYELYCEEDRRHFSIESVAMLAVSVIASATVWIVGASSEVRRLMADEAHSKLPLPPLDWFGAFGIVFSLCFYLFHRLAIKRLRADDITTEAQIAVVRLALIRLIPDWVIRCDNAVAAIAIDSATFATKDGDLRLFLAIQYAKLKGKRLIWNEAAMTTTVAIDEPKIAPPSGVPDATDARIPVAKEPDRATSVTNPGPSTLVQPTATDGDTPPAKP